ncbi:FGGY-family carbohydrate kinase [Cellulosimicrobium sp. ES-005]|uniref:FGGY-family carbohydrate kinase n=1 Tax=Cellulosimicrobium sp. ES-005 TaxID=3163031 RepID=A0AAU8G3M1_9MICO
MSRYLVGIDAGTSVVKAAVFDLDGTELTRAGRSVPVTNPAPHLAEEDMEQVWTAAHEAIQEAVAASGVAPEEILAVGATGQGDGSWLVGPDGRPVGPAYLWTDGRAGELIDGWYADGTVSRQFPVSGTGPYAGTTSALLRWRLENEPESLREGVTALWCKDWVEYRLTGELSGDPSDASLAGIDVRSRTWSDEVLDAWGLGAARHVLPRLLAPTDVCGTVTPEAAALTGLRAGTPVVKGQVDIAASSLGVGVIAPGDCMAVIGTAGIVTVATDDLSAGFAPADVGWVIPHGPDTWVRAMGMNSCTPNVDWFLRELGHGFHEDARARAVSLFEHLDATVASVPPGAGGVVFHGYTAPGGERAPFVKPSARGSFSGLTAGHSRDHMLRAVYEGVAYGIRDCLDSIPTEVGTVRLAGGGASSPVWSQVFADVLGRRVVVPAGSEFGAKGAALVAGVGVGAWSTLDEAVAETVDVERSYEPSAHATRVYDEYFGVYRQIREHVAATWDLLHAAGRRTEAMLAA